MARVKARSNVYAFLPFLACLIMGVGIGFTWVRIQDYRGPEPPATYQPRDVVPDYIQPEQPKVEEPVIEETTTPGEEEEPAAPDEGEEGVAPAEGDEGAAPAPAEGGEEEEPKEEER